MQVARSITSGVQRFISGTRRLSVLTDSQLHKVKIGLGSNLGNRASHIDRALDELGGFSKVRRTSFLYESDPMYITDQPAFLNAVCEIETTLSPRELLKRIKHIESCHGRNHSPAVQRFGPRVLDLDILLYDTQIVNIPQNVLTIPHPRLFERPFVLIPLCDIDPECPIPIATTKSDLPTFTTPRTLLSRIANRNICRVSSLPNNRLLRWSNRALSMGIVNATPDSFSDGGENVTLEAALQRVGEFVAQGIDIVDIGGQSTRPGARYVTTQEECSRVLPIISQVRQKYPDLCISVDTFRADVAEMAVAAGADIVNDVSAGGLDERMGDVVRKLGVVWVMMHMRGNSETMTTLTDYGQEGVVEAVVRELRGRVENAIAKGVRKWNVWTDPGLGFAKTATQSLELMSALGRFKQKVGDYPMLIGASRKSFVGKATGKDMKPPRCRDWASAGAAAIAIVSGADVVRIHNPHVVDAVRLANAVRLTSIRTGVREGDSRFT